VDTQHDLSTDAKDGWAQSVGKIFSRKGAKAQSLPGSKQHSLRFALRLCAFARENLSY
jgi:hypothetical protein